MADTTKFETVKAHEDYLRSVLATKDASPNLVAQARTNLLKDFQDDPRGALSLIAQLKAYDDARGDPTLVTISGVKIDEDAARAPKNIGEAASGEHAQELRRINDAFAPGNLETTLNRDADRLSNLEKQPDALAAFKNDLSSIYQKLGKPGSGASGQYGVRAFIEALNGKLRANGSKVEVVVGDDLCSCSPDVRPEEDVYGHFKIGKIDHSSTEVEVSFGRVNNK